LTVPARKPRTPWVCQPVACISSSRPAPSGRPKRTSTRSCLVARIGYGPIFDIDSCHDDILWEIWIGGFDRVTALRPDGWLMILEDDDENAQTALSGLVARVAVARGDEDAPTGNVEEQTDAAPELIAPPRHRAQCLAPAQRPRAADHRTRRTRSQGRTQRAVPPRLRQEGQDMLWAELISPFAGRLRETPRRFRPCVVWNSTGRAWADER